MSTVLRGFTVDTFTHGFRRAYRQAFAKSHGIADASRVIITNVRAEEEEAVAAKTRARRLAAVTGVKFDCQVSFETKETADAFNAEIRANPAAKEDEVMLTKFTQEIEKVKQNPEYDDITASFTASAAVQVSTLETQVVLETIAPTPAPTTGAGTNGVPVSVIAGAVAGVGALAGVALWRRHRTRRAAAKEVIHSAHALPELHEVYAAPGPADKKH